MECLARKIVRSKWDSKPYIGSADIRADAITGASLQMEGDNLSLWQCTSEREAVTEVVLALVENSRTSAIETMHIVLFEMRELITDEFILVCTRQNAQTLVADLKARHVDAIQLNMRKIVWLAENIAVKVRQNKNCYLFTRNQVLEILRRARKNGRLELDALTRLRQDDKNEIQK